MANNNFTPSRRDAGEIISPQQSILGVPTKSYIVGRYDDYGQMQEDGEFIGGERQSVKYKKLLIDSMSSHGRLMPGYVMTPDGPRPQAVLTPPKGVVGKRVAKKATKAVVKKAEEYIPITREDIYEDEVPAVEEPVKGGFIQTKPTQPKAAKTSFNVVFSIDSGKIKSVVNAVLETGTALLLVYEDEDAVSYIPEKGSHLIIITPDKREVPVLFLGLQFEWYNTRQQLLVFMKTEVDE